MPLNFDCFEGKTSAKAGKQKFTLKNPQGKLIKRFNCDAGVFPNDMKGKRCDYFFEVMESPIEAVFYVEFKKGRKVEDAIQQLKDTAQHPDIKRRHKNAKRKEGYAIVSGMRQPTSTKRQITLANFQEKHGFQPFIRENSCTVTV